MRVLRIYHAGVVAPWRRREAELRRQGVDVELVSARSWNEGGTVVELGEGEEPTTVGVGTWGSHPYRFLYDPIGLWRALRRRDVDVLDIHEEPASLATAEVLGLSWLSRRERPRVCLYSAQNIEKRYPPPFRWFERWALGRADAVHTCNEEAGRILRRKGFRGIVRNLGLGVDVAVFAPGEAGRDASAGGAGRLQVGYVGRLESHKGVAVLVDAVAQVPDVALRIVGDGPELEEIQRQVRRLGLADRVQVQGFTSAEQLPDVYRAFDLVVVPSLETRSWVEQFGRVAVEAMAAGAVIVASDSGSLPEVVGDAGLLVPPGDVGALATALRRLAADPEERARLRGLGPERAARYGWRAVAARQRALYEEMLG